MAEETSESVEDQNITEDLEELKGELTAVFHGQSQRITEYRVVVSQGLTRVMEQLETLLNSAEGTVRRNGEILAEAGEAASSTDRFEKLQSEMDKQIEDLKRVNDDLGDACERLRGEREEQSRLRKETSDSNDGIREEIRKLTTEIDRLEIDNEVLAKELDGLQRDKDLLQKEVDALQERRQEFLSSIAKYKEMKSGLLG